MSTMGGFTFRNYCGFVNTLMGWDENDDVLDDDDYNDDVTMCH